MVTRPALTHPRYQCGVLLGTGAQGMVVRVIDREAPHLPLVAKVHRPGIFDESSAASEFALLSRIDVPGLVRARDFARDERTGAPFLVEDFVDGPDAAAWIDEGSMVADRSERVEHLLMGVTLTLGWLHDAGFVHGDLKPAHVRLHGGRPVVVDLGAAVRCASVRRGLVPPVPIALTRAYAAPEVLAGGAPSPASDLYSLGALLWDISTGAPPANDGRSVEPSGRAPDVRPALRDVVCWLLERHPRDRPSDAREVLDRLARSTFRKRRNEPERAVERGVASRLIGHEETITALLGSAAPVTYLQAPAGGGKSRILREIVTRELLAGRAARYVSLSCPHDVVERLIAFLRGTLSTPPFVTPSGGELLVALDGMDESPDELRTALEIYACRPGKARVRFVASTRAAPSSATAIRPSALTRDQLVELCESLGEYDAERQADAIRQSGANPGWLAAIVRKIPLTREATLERLGSLSESARELLGVMALIGGDTPESLCHRLRDDSTQGLDELLASGLVSRARGGPAKASLHHFRLASLGLAATLASALMDFPLTDRVAGVLLEENSVWPSSLFLAVARSPTPPERRSELLRSAAERARAEGLRSIETEALLALAADPRERTPVVLRSLERLTRGVGNSGLHPEVISWLEEAAARHPDLEPLVLRRRADALARGGDYSAALSLTAQAHAVAEQSGDRVERGLALAASGAVHLYAARWVDAAGALAGARDILSENPSDDAEEMARLDHNLGVVALYGEHVESAIDAFRRSLETKRRLGDRGGVWACLMNLGLAQSKAAQWTEARAALDEALAITRSIEQTSGAAWCLAALAEVEIRAGEAGRARRAVSEAECLGDSLPLSVRTDLAIARAEIALLEGDAAGALEASHKVTEVTRGDDALADARVLVVRARALCCTLPADRRGAARAAIRAARRAREAGLEEIERTALAALREARSKAATPRRVGIEIMQNEIDDALWNWLARVSTDAPIDELAVELLALAVRHTGAERAFVFSFVDERSERAWGADVEGLPVNDPTERVQREWLTEALASPAPIYRPRIQTSGGIGARIAAASPRGSTRAVLVVEHRFIEGRFDAVPDSLVRRFTTLCRVIARMAARTGAARPEMRPADEASQRDRDTTTSLPLRRATRQFPTIVGSSVALGAALARLDAAIESDLPVLVWGETGVGKELFARALHDHGPRRTKPFVAVSCGAIPETLFEAELFGHTRGAFTGAERARPGLFARAEGGTLFLDEIGELPLGRQAVLLRALESRAVRPVGSETEKEFDVRIVAATNRDLAALALSGGFRSDLLYRINVLEIPVPPLRDREGDVVKLIRHFISKSNAETEIAPDALAALESYEWPGNVRELAHQIQRLVALGAARIELRHLPRAIRARAPRARIRPVPPPRRLDPDGAREELRRALAANEGNITRTAAHLGLTRHGLKKRMLRLGLRESESMKRNEG